MRSAKIFYFVRTSDFLYGMCIIFLRLYKLVSVSANMNLPDNNTFFYL